MDKSSAHTPFLRLVARTFVKHYAGQLHDFCFIFPNRRSSMFFIEELSALAASPMLSPCVTNITDFLTELTGSVEPSKIEQLFILYREYKQLMGDNAQGFDRFAYWGDIILNDFNDVDKYLADPRQIFTNIRDYKSIHANFLTDEQKNVIREYFGDIDSLNTDDNSFWRDPDVYGKKSGSHFVMIWDILRDLYERFNRRLEEQNLSYSGKIYRKAVTRVTEMGIDDFRYRKYIFVGFNVLSLSEIKIFKALGNKHIADYYWDCNSPALRDENNKASWFISKNISMFPSQLDIEEPEIEDFCPVNVIGIPSNIGQAKHTSKILDHLIDSGAITDTQNAINTAIVLPDEGLFIPLLDSLNERITGVNITMGFPLRMSDIAVLVNRIARLHKQSRKSGNDYIFFHEDVKDLLTHPFVRMINAEQCTRLNHYMAVSGLFYVPFTKIRKIFNQTASESTNSANQAAEQFKTPVIGDIYACDDASKPSLELIFEPIPSGYNTEMLIGFLNRIVRFVEAGLIANNVVEAESVSMGMISKFMDRLNQLSGAITKYDIGMNEDTFFYLVGRMISSVSVAFEGEPLHGLQIMGVLETRCLDFENVIVLSMNERVFPRKHYSRSFIPGNLRRGFGMATVDFQDCMYAYYFYRLISRAKNVYLLYDARRQSIGSGEYSRYIEQLDTLYASAKVNKQVLDFSINAPGDLVIEVTKNKRIMDRILRYTIPDSGYCLSASSINKYLNCPLLFYFEKVEDLEIADEVKEFMDASTLGTIVHDAMHTLYDGRGDITPEVIDRQLKKLVKHTVDDLIKKHYAHDNEGLTGETQILSDAISFFVNSILNYDKKLGLFRFIQGEEKQTVHWHRVNIRQFIDRVDKVIKEDGTKLLRIVDYKTGRDDTKAATVENMFEEHGGNRCKAMLQLMLYCNVYAFDKCLPYGTPIQPIIYKVQRMNESGFTVNKSSVDDYNTINDEFIRLFDGVIDDLLNEAVPFTQTNNTKHCEYCKFATFCHR